MITKIGNIFFIGIFSLLFVSSFAYGIDSLALAIKNSQGQTTQKIAVGSPFYVVLTIKGNYKGKIPVIPGLERITQLGTQTSSSYSSDGQKASQKVVFMYQVQSYNLATYTFGPLVLDYEGNSYTALPVEVEIIKDQPVQVLQQAEQDTLLKIALSKKSMVLGEDFFVTLKFYTRLVGVEIKDISPLELADAEVSPWEQIGQKEEIYNGEHYQTITVRSRIQPKKSGTFILPSMRVIYTKPVQNNQGQQNVFNLFSVFLKVSFFDLHLPHPQLYYHALKHLF